MKRVLKTHTLKWLSRDYLEKDGILKENEILVERGLKETV